jgi:predicted aspartyl protease
MTRHSFLAVIPAALLGLDAAAAADCKMLRIAEWPIRVEYSQVIVDGAVNGQPVGIELDTGSTRTMLFRSTAQQLGVPLRRTRGRMFGIGGETGVDLAVLDELKIGDTKRANVQMLVAGERDGGGNVDVLLGDDFFHKFDIEFDLAHGATRLFQPQGCDGVSLAYWAAGGARTVPIEPVNTDRPQILLSVKVNGHPIRALLDSGASTSLLTKADAAAAGVTPDTPGVVRAGTIAGLGRKTIPAYAGPFQSVEIGNERIEGTALVFADFYKDTTYTPTGSYLPRPLDFEQPMLLGVDFLRAHRVLISHSQQKIYFTYTGGTVFQTSFQPSRKESAAPVDTPSVPAEPQPQQPSQEAPAR